MKNILFILSGNISTTPRALKAIEYYGKFSNIDVVAVNRQQSWYELDKILVAEYNLNYTSLSLQRKPLLKWLLISFINKVSKLISPLFKKSLKLNAFASDKTMILLWWYLKKLKSKYHLVAAHSYSSLFAAYKFSKKFKVPFIFDIEDYHPGEATYDKHEKNRREFLMNKLLPQASYITYASPLIGEHSLKLLNSQLTTRNSQLINNCFSQTEFEFKENNSEKVKFVWFSQNIAAGRGLELVLPALIKFKNKVELHLIGNLYQNFFDDYLAQFSEIIIIHKPLPQKQLNLKLSEFDVGLAIEPGKDFNREICLTNKIWAYLQSGLYILATDTPAQIKFIEEHNNSGVISKQDINSFTDVINNVVENIEQIRQNKKPRFEYSKNYSWDVESEKLTEILNNILF